MMRATGSASLLVAVASLAVAASLPGAVAQAKSARIMAASGSLLLWCDRANKRALMFLAEDDDTPDHGKKAIAVKRERRCDLPGGRTIRVRVGTWEARATGPCGADPPEWLHLWVNGRKVLDDEEDYNCHGQILKLLTVTAGKAEVCRYDPPKGSDDDKPEVRCDDEPIRPKPSQRKAAG
jgi:hypothetical protein